MGDVLHVACEWFSSENVLFVCIRQRRKRSEIQDKAKAKAEMGASMRTTTEVCISDQRFDRCLALSMTVQQFDRNNNE